MVINFNRCFGLIVAFAKDAFMTLCLMILLEIWILAIKALVNIFLFIGIE